MTGERVLVVPQRADDLSQMCHAFTYVICIGVQHAVLQELHGGW